MMPFFRSVIPNCSAFALGVSLLLPRYAAAIDILVTTNADSGNGTLRQAIQFNESLGGGNTIVFSNTVTGTINLTNALGELLITKDVTIVGPGARVLAVSGNNSTATPPPGGGHWTASGSGR